MSEINKYLGHATAYGYAVSKGYTGTEEEFAELMADYGDVGQDARRSAENAEAWAVGKRNGSDVDSTDITYNNNAKYYSEQAADDSASAFNSATTAATSESNADASARAAEGSANAASGYADASANSASSAAGSAVNASASAQTATTKAGEADASAVAANESKIAASLSETNAKASETAAAQSATAADQSAQDIAASSEQIQTNKDDITELKNELSSNAIPIVNTASGAIASFSDGADDVPVRDLVVNIEPVQSGSGDPSPDNVRPISGWTGMNVQRTGKNLFNPNSSDNLWIGSDGTFIHFTSVKSVTIPAKVGQVLTASMSNPRTSSNLLILVFFDIGGNVISRNIVGTGEKVLTATAPVNTASALCSLYTYSEAGDVQLELGSTATDYEPYQGNTYSVDWTDTAGTVYGGQLDVTTGVLTVDKAYITGEDMPFIQIEGEGDNWVTVRFGRFFMLSPYPNLYSNRFSTSIPSGTPGRMASTNVKNIYLVLPKSELESIDESGVTKWLTEHPTQIIGDLATPQTYQLTPTEVKTLLGQNNIFADTGDIASVDYVADTKAYIDDKFAELQALILENA